MPSWTEVGDKTLWDWLKLFVISLVLATVVVAFNSAENSRTEKVADRRAETERQVANLRADMDRQLAATNAEAQRKSDDLRAQTELKIAGDRFREEALGTYFEKISKLLLERDLYRSSSRSESREIARTLTFVNGGVIMCHRGGRIAAVAAV